MPLFKCEELKTIYTQYRGEYEVTPKFEEQELKTKNKMLNKFDYRMISLDGTSADGKYAKAVCTFNIDDETVKDLTKIRAYLWNGMTAMRPQSASCDLTCGAAE